MPIYKNETSKNIVAKYRNENNTDVSIVIEPNRSYSSENIISDYETLGLTKVSDSPYFNPALIQNEITSNGVGDDKTVNIDGRTKSIEIINSSSAIISVFVNSLDNSPSLKVSPTSTRKISNNFGKISGLILQFNDIVNSGECFITQLK